MAARNELVSSSGQTVIHNVAVSSTGRLYIVDIRSNGGNEELVVFFSDDDGATWQSTATTVTTTENVPNCAIDSEDVLHIVYEKGSYEMVYRTYSGGSFGSEESIFDGTANTDHIDATDIAIDSDDVPHVVWTQTEPATVTNVVYYSERSSGSWASRTLLSQSGVDVLSATIDVVINSQDEIYVVWGTGTALDEVFVNKNSAGSWSGPTEIHDTGGANLGGIFSMVVDSIDDVHLVFTDSGPNLQYMKFDESVGTWSGPTSIESTDVVQGGQPAIGVDSSDNLTVVFTASDGDIRVMTSTDGGSTWGTDTEIIDLTNSLSRSRFNTSVFPIVEGVSTQVPSSGYQFTFFDVIPDSTYLHISDGRTLQTPKDQNYTRGDESALPSADAVLENTFTTSGYTNVSSDDNNFETQTATDEYSIFLFKDRGVNVNGDITVTWKGKSDIACSTSTVTLQIYNYNTPAWETLDSDSTTAAGTEFTLTGSKTASQSNYYDDEKWVTCRVYQLAQ